MSIDSTIAVRQRRAWATTQDVIVNVRKATWSRVAFAIVMATLSLVVLPWKYAALWVAFVVKLGWRCAWRWKILLVLPAAARSEREGEVWLAVVNFVGGAAHALPLPGVVIGAPLNGAGDRLVQFPPTTSSSISAPCVLLASCVAPLAVCAIIAPFATGGAQSCRRRGAWRRSRFSSSPPACSLRPSPLARQPCPLTSRADAEQANAARSQFLATMSHELRTPLNAVIGYAELIEEDTAETAVREDAGKIRGSARQLLSVIDTILDIQYPEAASSRCTPEAGANFCGAGGIA
ncbi:MAG: histidine kinase dimerization/phospho-acceptor domain-containing protein [Hyphomonadaceae bacterium]